MGNLIDRADAAIEALILRTDTATRDSLVSLRKDWLVVVDTFGERHPFTSLCLLGIVRVGWRDPCIHVAADGSTWCVTDGNLDDITITWIDTEPEALLAALEAAPS